MPFINSGEPVNRGKSMPQIGTDLGRMRLWMRQSLGEFPRLCSYKFFEGLLKELFNLARWEEWAGEDLLLEVDQSWLDRERVDLCGEGRI